jgi:hypothetical protein
MIRKPPQQAALQVPRNQPQQAAYRMPNINQQIVVAQQVNNRKMKTSSLDEQ